MAWPLSNGTASKGHRFVGGLGFRVHSTGNGGQVHGQPTEAPVALDEAGTLLMQREQTCRGSVTARPVSVAQHNGSRSRHRGAGSWLPTPSCGATPSSCEPSPHGPDVTAAACTLSLALKPGSAQTELSAFRNDLSTEHKASDSAQSA